MPGLPQPALPPLLAESLAPGCLGLAVSPLEQPYPHPSLLPMWENSTNSQRSLQSSRSRLLLHLPPNDFAHGWLEPQVLPTLIPTFPNTPHKSYS